MTINDKIRDEELQYDISKEAVNISALSSDKIDKCEYLTGEEILPFDQNPIIKQANFTYSPLEKALGIQTKLIEDQGEKQIEEIKNRDKKQLLDTDQKSITSLFAKDFLTEQAIYELNKITEKKYIYRDDLIYKTGYKKKDETYNFPFIDK